MKRFLTQIILFILIITLITEGVNLLTTKTINNKASFKLTANIDKVIVGHSHPESAYNDSLIKGFANIAQSGESYFYSYYKIKELIKQNSNVKYIFLEFTNNQIEKEIEKWIWGEETLAFRYPTYSTFIDKEGYLLLISKNAGAVLNLQVKSLMKKVKFIATNSYDYIKKTGGYVYLIRDKTDSLLKTLGNIKKSIMPSGKIAEYNLQYLDKIIAFCKKENVSIFLIRSPMHQKTIDLINEQTFQQIRNERYGHVEYLDFKDFPLANHEFGDFSHLNYKGAKKYSNFLNELLEKGLLTKHNKQLFIDSSMQTITK